MKRGQIWWVRLDRGTGGEIRKARPAIIVSNDAANKHLNRVQIVPLSRSTEKVYPSEALVEVDGAPNKAMADQIMTVSKERLTNLAGQVDREGMLRVADAIRVQLGM